MLVFLAVKLLGHKETEETNKLLSTLVEYLYNPNGRMQSDIFIARVVIFL